MINLWSKNTFRYQLVSQSIQTLFSMLLIYDFSCTRLSSTRDCVFNLALFISFFSRHSIALLRSSGFWMMWRLISTLDM